MRNNSRNNVWLLKCPISQERHLSKEDKPILSQRLDETASFIGAFQLCAPSSDLLNSG
jgi:hypothetical protein|nr:hypothetical protein [Providencia rettgeri]